MMFMYSYDISWKHPNNYLNEVFEICKIRKQEKGITDVQNRLGNKADNADKRLLKLIYFPEISWVNSWNFMSNNPLKYKDIISSMFFEL